MKDQIAYSSIKLTIEEQHEYFAEKTKAHFGAKIINSFKSGFDMMLSVILAAISIWPLLLFVLLPFMFRKRILAKWRNN
jgi:hypothetical protein